MTQKTFEFLWRSLYEYDIDTYNTLVLENNGSFILTQDILQVMWSSLQAIYPDAAVHAITYGHLDNYVDPRENGPGLFEAIYGCFARKRGRCRRARHDIVIPTIVYISDKAVDESDTVRYNSTEWHDACKLLRCAPPLTEPMEGEIWRDACARLHNAPPLATPNAVSCVSPSSSAYTSDTDSTGPKKIVICGTSATVRNTFVQNMMKFNTLNGVSKASSTFIMHGSKFTIWNISDNGCSRNSKKDIMKGADTVIILYRTNRNSEVKLATTYWKRLKGESCPNTNIIYVGIRSTNNSGNVSPATIPEHIEHLQLIVDLHSITGYQQIIDRII